MMEAGKSQTAAVKKTNLTPKAIIHQRFGSKACYKVEEVKDSTPNDCPGLAILQKGPSLYRCILDLPELSVTSETFKKKKDAEQSAAEMALRKLGIHLASDNPTEEEAWEALTDRIRYLFSNEFLPSLHPLSGHIRATLRRDGDLCGLLPASIIAACDAKSSNLCKLLSPKVESNPLLAVSCIMRAAAKSLEPVVTSQGQLTIRKCNPYPPELVELPDKTEKGSSVSECIQVEAILIPSSQDKIIQSVILPISPDGYYLDVIAQRLGEMNANKVLLSRTVGKASSETRLHFAATRLHFAAPQSYMLDLSMDLANGGEVHLEGSLNIRASYLCGQHIYGDAIMASIGYSWRSEELFHEDVSLQSYYRMLISKTPSGIYKLSRDAILAADLPLVFTTKANWRGSFPREILCSFCRQHRLSEPVFSAVTSPSCASGELLRSNKKLKVTDAAQQESGGVNVGDGAVEDKESAASESAFRCELKLFNKCQDLVIECSPKEIYRKQTDSIHNVSLKVLSWLNAYFKDIDMPVEKLTNSANALDIRLYPEIFSKEFVLCPFIHHLQHNKSLGSKSEESASVDMTYTSLGRDFSSLKIEGLDSGVYPSNGCVLCISYCVSLVTVGEHIKELLESKDEFEFEMGIGAVISPLEAAVTQMSVGQSASFSMDLPPMEFILAAAGDSARILSLVSSQACCLDYCITLSSVTEPPEERMEQALFSPPLSKQRVEYAVQHIRKSSASTLVDYGCGSGSLLDLLLDYPTSLQKVVGVDISQKSLSRAAKILHTKLSTKSDMSIKSALLYDGSITEFDSRLCGFDIGTCLEVIEHMEEEQAFLFGDVALGYFRPKILIVSTPNYEYNVILQKSSFANHEEDLEEKNPSGSCRFRNHDHKFEWTREQFEHWASELAVKHNYSVEFSGVGGFTDVEPGFASQIALFKREIQIEEDNLRETESSSQHCKLIWEWNTGE